MALSKVPTSALAADVQTAIANSTPSGAVSFFAMSSAPSGWLKANGAAVSRTTYAALFAAVGTTFGVGDGSTTFNLPDLRGEFVRSWADNGSIDSGRTFGSKQKATLVGVDGPGGYNGVMPYTSVSTWESVGTEQASSSDYPGVEVQWANYGYSGTNRWATTDAGVGQARPRNIALLACVKY